MLKFLILLIPFALVGFLETRTLTPRVPVVDRPARLRWFDTQLSRWEPPIRRLPVSLTDFSGSLA